MFPRAVIFDVDGTLADVSALRRRHLPNTRGHKDFTAFHRESAAAPAHGWVVQAAQALGSAGFAIIVVTARKAMWRNHTAMWLALNQVPSHRLYMRADTDQRPDYEVKRGILARIRTSFDVALAFDDNPNVLKLWREEGIPTVRVPGWQTPLPR